MSVENQGETGFNSFRVIGWNVRDGLDDDNHATAIAEQIITQNPDVVFLPEASANVSLDDAKHDALEMLEEAIGPTAEIPYGDRDGRVDTHTFVACARPAFGSARPYRAAGRSALYYQPGPDIVVAGLHGYDRLRHGTRQEHQGTRYAQLDDVRLAFDGIANVLLAGDFNLVDTEDPNARFVRRFGPLFDVLQRQFGIGEPREPQSKPQRVISLGQRLVAMTEDETLSTTLLQNGYTDAPLPATKKLGPIKMQLDRLVYRGAALTGAQFVRLPANGLSDHAMILGDFFYSPDNRQTS